VAVLVRSKGETWGALRLSKVGLVSQGREGILSPPLVAADGVYIDEWYETAEVVKLHRQTLEAIWRVKTREGPGPGGGLSPLRMWSDDLILMGGQDRIGMMEADSGRLRWAVSEASGPLVWNRRVVVKSKAAVLLIDGLTGATTDRYPLAAKGASTLCGDRLVVLPEDDDWISSLELGTGKVMWRRELLREMGDFARFDFKTNAIGLVAGSRPTSVVATRGPVVFGLSVEDGSIRWGAPVAVTYYWPNVHDGRIYVLLMDHFVCLDEATGEIVYDVQHPQLAEAFLPQTGTIYGAKIAFAMETGHLAVFDLTNGRLVWLYKHKLKLGRTAEVDGRLLATTDDGHLLVFEDRGR